MLVPRSGTMTLHPPPSSAETRLSVRPAHAFNNPGCWHSFFLDLPCRMGFDVRVDTAAEAAISAHDYWFHKDVTTTATYTDRTYQAVRSLRPGLTTDDSSLVSATLLGLADKLVEPDPWVTDNAQLRGILAIMEARPIASDSSELARCITVEWASTDDNFWRSCRLGMASSWDSDRWLAMQIHGCYPPQTSKPRDLVFQLFVRVPGLIARVRCCREMESCPPLPLMLQETLVIAEALLDVVDADAESQLLHLVKARPTADLTLRAIMPFSFEFRSDDEHEVAVEYWKLRFMTIRLYLMLQGLQNPTLSGKGGMNQADISRTDTTLAALFAEEMRLAVNIHMSCPPNLTRILNPKGWTLTIVALWGALSGMTTLRTIRAGVIRGWVLRRFREVLGDWTETVSATTLDESAELFAGGPLTGLLVSSVR